MTVYMCGADPALPKRRGKLLRWNCSRRGHGSLALALALQPSAISPCRSIRESPAGGALHRPGQPLSWTGSDYGRPPAWDADTPLSVGLAEPLRQTGCLLSEEQKAVVPKDSLGIVPRRLGGSQPQIRGWVLGKEVVQIRVDTQIHHGPVIQSGPADRFLTDVEAQRLYQMKAAAGGGTGCGQYCRSFEGSPVLQVQYSARLGPPLRIG